MNVYVWCTVLVFLTLQLLSVSSQFQSFGSNAGPGPGPGAVSCPERNGRFPVGSQCDLYLECEDGVGQQKLCPDGLLFNANARFFSYPCQYPAEVDCQGRTAVQPAQATAECPHQFGYYREGDANNCGKFRNCANGVSHIFDCPEGLAFNEQSLRCDWPDQVDTCNAEAFLGFTCPNVGQQNSLFGPEGFQYFRSPSNCQKYFLCINGRPRLFSCGEGQAFNELTRECDGIENVTGCGAGQPGRPQQFFAAQGFSPAPTAFPTSPSSPGFASTAFGPAPSRFGSASSQFAPQQQFSGRQPQFRAQRNSFQVDRSQAQFRKFDGLLTKQAPQRLNIFSNNFFDNNNQ